MHSAGIRSVPLIGVVALVMVGCSVKVNETAPVLSKFELSAAEIDRGQTVTGTANVEDDQRDLEGGSIEATICTESTKPLVQTTGNGAVGSVREGRLSMRIEFFADTETGPCTISLVVSDKAGHRSNPVTATILIK